MPADLLTIRRGQMAVFEAERRRVLCEDAIRLVRERYPAEWARFGEAEVRALVLLAMRKARQWGVTGYGDLLRIVNLMFTLGCGFDEDPDHPWAREVLARADLRPASRVDLLVARALAHLQSLERDAAGPMPAAAGARA